MTTQQRMLAALGIEDKRVIPRVANRAWAMYNALGADPAAYPAPNPSLPIFLGLIQGLATAQQQVAWRTLGAAEERDVQRDLLITGMESLRMYVQTLCDSAPSRSLELIRNAGLLVAGSTAYSKPLLTLRLTRQPGTIACDANVGLLLKAAGKKRSQNRFFNWELTLNGGQTFAALPTTPNGKTTVPNLPQLTLAGVRVSVTTSSGTGAWSPVVTILVH